MAQHRTKHDKIAAQLKRETVTYTFESNKPVKKSPTDSTVSTERTRQEMHVFGYDVSLVYRDLLRTVMVSVFILIVLAIVTYISYR